jgi:hypothetical protein
MEGLNASIGKDNMLARLSVAILASIPLVTPVTIELVSGPEPGMLAVFGVMAPAGMEHPRLRQSAGR